MSNVFDKHNQFIIRFPEDVADAINEYFENGEEGVEITLQADPEPKNTTKRVSLKVTVDEKTYDASVVSMPTVSSTFKTIDRINFFKSNDVSEMIYVHENEFDILNESDAEPIKKVNRAGQ
jgi:TATA-binding protein-associated factor Taf7